VRPRDAEHSGPEVCDFGLCRVVSIGSILRPGCAMNTSCADAETEAHMSITLVALDESEGAKRALDWALTHRGSRESLVLVTVLPMARAGQGYEPPHASERAHAEEFLDKMVNTAGDLDGSPISREVLEGSPAGEILEAIRRHGADHVVIGARGEGGVARLLIGSVSNALVHHAPCPVTVVPLNPREE